MAADTGPLRGFAALDSEQYESSRRTFPEFTQQQRLPGIGSGRHEYRKI